MLFWPRAPFDESVTLSHPCQYRPNSDKVIAVDWLRCAAKATRCSQQTCNEDDYAKNPDYVCGNDGRTYPSPCHLRLASCKYEFRLPIPIPNKPIIFLTNKITQPYPIRRGTELAHVGACMKIVPDNQCPESCLEQEESDLPVCGSDGNVYRSEFLSVSCSTSPVFNPGRK